MNNLPVIDKIKKQLEVFPNLPLVQEENTLFVEPRDSNGFKVLVEDNLTDFVVFCDGWSYDILTDFESVAQLFVFPLTAAARLLVREKNQKRYWWLLESCLNGEWGGIEVTFRPGQYSLFTKKKTYYLQNDWINIEDLKPWIREEFTADKIKF
jgi:hypothetical protein